jgi:hypothetical protein
MDLNFSVVWKPRNGLAVGSARAEEPSDSQWELIRAAILEALLPYREARDAVAKAIFSLCG